MEFILLFLVLIGCFFLLYILCRQDFVLLRQNISLAQILDSAIISIVFAFITARLLFLINNLEMSLLHVIRFFHFIKFPGVSPLGFFLGTAFSLWVIFRKRKGIFRVFDIFAISFLPLYLFSLVIKKYPGVYALILPIFLAAVVLGLFIFFIKSHYKYIMRDGSISIIILLLISLDSLFYDYINPDKFAVLLDLSIGQILGIILVSGSIIFLFINQRKLKI